MSDQLRGILNYIASALTADPIQRTTSERSFSALRRLKTYLMISMTQERLTNLVLMHVHKDISATVVEHKKLMQHFVSKNSKRLSVFRKFG